MGIFSGVFYLQIHLLVDEISIKFNSCADQLSNQGDTVKYNDYSLVPDAGMVNNVSGCFVFPIKFLCYVNQDLFIKIRLILILLVNLNKSKRLMYAKRNLHG